MHCRGFGRWKVDANLIAADANKQRSIAGQDRRRDRDPARSSRAVKEYLAPLKDAAVVFSETSDGPSPTDDFCNKISPLMTSEMSAFSLLLEAVRTSRGRPLNDGGGRPADGIDVPKWSCRAPLK